MMASKSKRVREARANELLASKVALLLPGFPGESKETLRVLREAGASVLLGKTKQDPWDGARGYHAERLSTVQEEISCMVGPATRTMVLQYHGPKPSASFVPAKRLRPSTTNK